VKKKERGGYKHAVIMSVQNEQCQINKKGRSGRKTIAPQQCHMCKPKSKLKKRGSELKVRGGKSGNLGGTRYTAEGYGSRGGTLGGGRVGIVREREGKIKGGHNGETNREGETKQKGGGKKR